jgi:hypothetical protein
MIKYEHFMTPLTEESTHSPNTPVTTTAATSA